MKKWALGLVLLLCSSMAHGSAFVQMAQTSCTNCSSVTFGSNLTVGGTGHLGVFVLNEINAGNAASTFSATTGANWVKESQVCTNNGGVFSCKTVYVSCNLTAGNLNATFTQGTPPDGYMIETFYEASGIVGNKTLGCIDKSQTGQFGAGACGCTGGCPPQMQTCTVPNPPNSMPGGDWIVAIGLGVNIPSQAGAPTISTFTGELPAGGGGGVTGYAQVVGSGTGGTFRGDTNVADLANPTSQTLVATWTYGGSTGTWATEMIAFGSGTVLGGVQKKRFWQTP